MNKRICFYCRRKGNAEEMIKEEKVRKEKITFRYYHEECKIVEQINRKNNKKRTGFGNSEGDSHSDIKIKTYNLIKKNKLTLVDQFGDDVNLIGTPFMESPLSRLHGNKALYHDVDTCKECFNKYGLDSNQKYHDELRSRIVDYKSVKSGEHPCLSCPFNTLSYKFIFDIAFAKNGVYHTVIEILHTSKCKKEKILYCIKNKINLYELSTKEEISNNEVHVKKLWWINSLGKIEIHNDYKTILEGK